MSKPTDKSNGRPAEQPDKQPDKQPGKRLDQQQLGKTASDITSEATGKSAKKSTGRTAIRTNKPANDTLDKSSGRNAHDRRFWRALQKDMPSQQPNAGEGKDSDQGARNSGPPRLIDLTADLSELSAEERETRRQALRSMLAASEARQQQVLRTRLPTFTPGLVVLVRSGPFRQRQGVVIDADYIHSRVLLDFSEQSETQKETGTQANAHWIEFARIAPVNPTEPAAFGADPDPASDSDPSSGS